VMPAATVMAAAAVVPTAVMMRVRCFAVAKGDRHVGGATWGAGSAAVADLFLEGLAIYLARRRECLRVRRRALRQMGVVMNESAHDGFAIARVLLRVENVLMPEIVQVL